LSSYQFVEDLQQSSSRYGIRNQSYIHHTNLIPAGPLGLLEEDAPGAALTTMLQGLTRFFLDRLAQDWRSIPPHSLAFEQVRDIARVLDVFADPNRSCLPPLRLPSDA
jgi:hypothetical protein